MRKSGIRWMAYALFALACLLPLLWLQPFGHSRSLQFAVHTNVSLNVWIYSKPVARLLSEYQSQHPEINIEVRAFRSEDQLYEELAAAISTHVPPHMAEVGSGFDMGSLADTGELIPFDDPVSTETVSAVDARYAGAFRYGGRMWAMPYGAVIPVLYYNENLLRLPTADLGDTAMTWEQLMQEATGLTKDVDGDGITDIWGFVAGRNSLGGSIAMSGAASAEEASRYMFGVWHELVYRYKAMPALEHHLALSNFIDGTAGMLLAPSDIRSMLEEYIGGTFGFGLLPVPNINRGDVTSVEVNGFAMLRSTPEIQDIVLRLAAYLLEADPQRELLAKTSKLPIREGIVARILEQASELSERERALLRIAAGKLQLEAAGMMTKPVRERVLDIQERLEGSEDTCLTCMAQDYMSALTEGMR